MREREREREREIRKEYGAWGGGTSGMYHHHPTK